MIRKILILIVLSIVSTAIHSKERAHALGIRGGVSSGFEYRYSPNETSSFKFLLSSRNSGFQLHGMYELHQKGIFDFPNRLTLFYGGGIHAGYESWYRSYYVGHSRLTELASRPLAGFDLLGGVEYPFLILPLSVGIEVKPFVDFWGKNYVRVQPFDFAFTLKFHF